MSACCSACRLPRKHPDVAATFDPLRLRPRGIGSRRVKSRIQSLTHVSGALEPLVNLAQRTPLALERVVYPCHSMNCGDIIYKSTLDPTLRQEFTSINPVVWVFLGISLIYLTASPGVLQGFWDTYFAGPILQFTRPSLSRTDVEVGQKLAEGGFGTVYLGKTLASVPGKIIKGQKIIVKKATEFGEAEVWMNERLTRAAPNSCATFLTAYADGTARVGTPLVLVWKYEGRDTLFDVLKARDFPYNVERVLLGRELKISDPVKRRLATTKVIMTQILTNLAAMHKTGIVHRDVKPQNMIISQDGSGIKFIDLGAAADLRVGINYVPNEYLLDPRFAPPQQYVMSPLTPKAPSMPLAAFLSPVLWRLNQPDRFDMYSVGIVMVQLAFPSLRSDNAIVAFNEQLEKLDYDIRAWRREQEKGRSGAALAEGFALLDADNGAGWDLLCKLVALKPLDRLSARQALDHPWIKGIKGSFGKRVTDAVDGAIESVVGPETLNALAARAESLSEVQLYSELNKDEEEQAPPVRRDMPRTIAWWQSRAKQQEYSGGAVGRVLRQLGGAASDAMPSRPKQRPRMGNATMRAFGPAAGSGGSQSATRPNGKQKSVDEAPEFAKVRANGVEHSADDDKELAVAKKGSRPGIFKAFR